MAPPPRGVVNVLSNREPANERDLIAFVLDHVDTVMRRIRYGDTNIVRMFWRENKEGQRQPKIENDCRDIFLHDLNREVAPMGVRTIDGRRQALRHGDHANAPRPPHQRPGGSEAR